MIFCLAFPFTDDDLITIFDSSDLSFAIQCSRILKLTLFGKKSKHVLLVECMYMHAYTSIYVFVLINSRLKMFGLLFQLLQQPVTGGQSSLFFLFQTATLNLLLSKLKSALPSD